MITIDSIKKTVLLAGGLFLSVLSANAYDIQDKLNYFRSPEAAAFMKYGEESVNEYTGTANISVPLYTVKCKDIEIPLVLNYNASGIKVDQEASWVGLGWDLTVGGCINYVSAGSKDMIHAAQIPDDSWTQYLTTINKTPWYTDETHKKSIWMSTVPYEYSFVGPYREDVNDGWGVKQYLDSGYGERDFYSVNVLGKSFMFFVDPHTLNVYKIGQAGDEYKVELEYTLGNVRPGLGRQSDISEWKITDSNGFVYIFKERDIIREPYNSQTEYTSCWYLSEIKSPLIENVTFSYEKRPRQSRPQRIESLCIPIITEQTVAPNDKTYKINESDFPSGFNNTPYFISAPVTNSYVKTIKTQNQTVIFDTSECQENSGRRLNSIVVLSCNNDTVKNYVFSYGEFGYSGIGGNEGISDKSKTDLRLKLDNVKEIASGETHTTSFSYYSTDLPSRMSCARDYWGYYNGKQNKRVKAGRYTLIPAPHEFMSRNYNTELSKRYVDVEYADRFSRGDSMQVGMLNRIDYPTGGYTTYEYEPNRILTTDFTLTNKYRDKKYDESYNMSFSWDNQHGAYQTYQAVTFELPEETTFDVYVRTQGSLIKGTDMKIMLIKWGSSESYIPITCTCSGNFDLINKKELKVLSAGKYTLRIIPPDAKGPSNGSIGWGITCQLKGWHKSTLSQSNYTLTCGGLRIRKICNFDNDNSLIDSIAYNYNDSKGSTGVLLNNIETIDVHKYKLFKTTQSPNPSENTQRNDYAKADVYSITPGKSRMSEFYASYNPGIVGYSQVTKRKYNSEGKIERYTVTKYRNTAPKNNVIDYYKYEDCYNGCVLCQDILDADSNLILRTNNTYNIKLGNHYAVNMWHDHETISGNSVSASYTGENIPKTTIWRYPYILSRVELAKATTTEFCPNGKTIVRTKDYSYNPKNHQVSLIDENTSLSNQIQRTRIKYSVDDDKCKVMVNSYHRLNDVVETKKILVENGKENCVSTQRTTYNGGLYSLPISSSTSVGNAPLEIRAKYTYDNGCNVRSVMIDGKETIYIWSYNSQYPIAKIEGLTFADIRNAIGQIENSQYPKEMPITDRALRALDEMRSETDQNKISTFITTIRKKVNELGGYITTYTYKPLVGITSETLPNGMKTTYKYDGFGRLTKVLDHNGSVISTNSYNYKK